MQHLFQVLGSEFWGGNFVILYVVCVGWNDFLYDSFPQCFPELRIGDLPQLLASVGLVKFRLELGQWGVVFPKAKGLSVAPCSSDASSTELFAERPDPA